MRLFLRRLWYLLRLSRRDAELREELETHRAFRQAQLERDGFTPTEASLASRRALGNVVLAREDARREWLAPLIDDLWQDLRLAARRLIRRPVFASTAILTFALGIGGNTAVFSAVDTLLLRDLPIPRPKELSSLVRVGARERGESLPFPAFTFLKSNAKTLGAIAGYAPRVAHLGTHGGDGDVAVHLVSGDYFHVLEVPAAAGRTLDDVPESDLLAVAVIGDTFRHRYLDPSASPLGAPVTINDVAYTVVGVMPPGFEGLSLDLPADVWLSIRAQPQVDGQSALDAPGVNWVRGVTRLANSGSSRREADESARLAEAFKASSGSDVDIRRIDLVAASRPDSGARALLTAPLSLMLVVAALVLLVACINLAYLIHARAAARARECAIQAAIGASRARLARQLVTETLLLALIGGAVGTAFARLGTAALQTYIAAHTYGSFQPPAWLTMRMNPAILLFALAMAVISGLVTGVAPARRAGAVDLLSGLRGTPAGSNASPAATRTFRLIVTQLALSLLLLVVAGAFIESFRKLESIDLGFRPEGLFQVDTDWERSPLSTNELLGVASAIVDDLRHIPGVADAGMSVPGVFGESTWQTSVSLPESRDTLLVPITAAAPGYLSALGIQFPRGQDFGPEDVAGSRAVAILSEALARKLFPAANPVGHDVRLYGAQSPVRVIGVASDIHLRDVLAPPPALIYVPFRQGRGDIARSVTWTVRSALPPTILTKNVERIVHARSPASTVVVRAVTDLVGQSVFLERTMAWLTAIFGLLGLGLAVVGTYGIVSYNAERRMPEIGLRLALGATPSGMCWKMCASSIKPITIGALLGCAASIGALRVISAYFQGIFASAPVAVALAVLVLMSTATLACLVPALRASKADPLQALRSE